MKGLEVEVYNHLFTSLLFHHFLLLPVPNGSLRNNFQALVCRSPKVKTRRSSSNRLCWSEHSVDVSILFITKLPSFDFFNCCSFSSAMSVLELLDEEAATCSPAQISTYVMSWLEKWGVCNLVLVLNRNWEDWREKPQGKGLLLRNNRHRPRFI